MLADENISPRDTRHLYEQKWEFNGPDFEHTFLRGDGRLTVHCYKDEVPPGTKPTPVTKAQGRTLVEHFIKEGVAYHSGRGSTVWVLQRYCAEANVPYHFEPQHFEGQLVGFISKIGHPE